MREFSTNLSETSHGFPDLPRLPERTDLENE
jgi:hypothetical protein